jgi:hypothetical protein
VNDHIEDDLYLRLTQLARSMETKLAPPTVPLTMTVEEVVSIVSGAEYAAITLVEYDRTLTTLAWSHGHPLRLDEIQQERQQGPSIHPAWDENMVRVNDLASDTRWPAFRADALFQTPIRSMVVFEMFTARELVGTLTVSAERPDVFDGASIALGTVCAAHLASSMDIIRRRDEFLRELADDEVEEQAKEMLMARFEIDAATAGRLLDRLNGR